MTKPSVVYFTNLYPLPWEPTRAAYNQQIVTHLRDHCDVSVLTPVPASVWLKQLFKGNLCSQDATLFPFFFLPGFGRRTYAFTLLLSMILCVYPAVRLIKARHIVASWAYPEGVIAALCKRLFGSKVVIHCVGTDINHHFQHLARRKQMLWAFSNVDNVVTVSRDLAEKIAEFAPATTHLRVVYNGVNFNLFAVNRTLPPNGYLLFVGNLIKTKGVFELIDAMALLKQKGIHPLLKIVGKGPEAPSLAARIEAAGLSDTVSLCGAKLHSEIPALLENAHALVLPSYREGVPNVIMESLAAGVPPVATAVGGIPEIITDGSNGILINKLSVQSLADSIERVYETQWTPSLLRNSIASYTWQHCADGFLAALAIKQPKP